MTTPIKDYALIGNCETAALINPRGGIDWLCLPAFDAGSFFGALLDEKKGGHFKLAPTEQDFQVEQQYRDASAILETRFRTAQGSVKATDFFVIARRAEARFYDFTSLHPTRKLVRLVEWEGGGAVEMEWKIEARPDYARAQPDWRALGEHGYTCEQAAVFTNASLQSDGRDLSGRFQVTRECPLFLVLDYAEERRAPDWAETQRWLEVTAAFWREWNLFNYYRGAHADLVRRSAVTLKLLTYAATGGFVAAPTTSLPEGIGGQANWDYRFTWVRDTALFIQTLFGLGYSGEATAFIDFAVKNWREKSGQDGAAPTVQVMFPVCDAPIPPEAELDHLAGYAGSQPVRMGNAAEEQFQLDNYGHLLQSLFYFHHTGGKIDRDKRAMIAQLAAEAKKLWPRDDNGIWEERTEHPYTFGKIMCWLALQRTRDLSGDPDGSLERTCAEIRAEILRRGVKEKDGRPFLSARFDRADADASLLLAFTSGFLERDLAVTTRTAIEEELGQDPLLRRNWNDEKEGAFVLCNFWRIDHLIREGDLKRAEELVEEMITRVSPLGLLSEEIDPATGNFLGNFPQAFSHLGLIQSILNLDAAKKENGFHALPDHEKFRRSVGATIGWKGVIAGFFRVPRTLRLLFSSQSKWQPT